ncbi:hypothetical protein H6P81_003369 [Aristolochia fimbriata]|uniref:Reverse transcriptase/retrotransposon-derived protein RNase H-like domain-containing protein n=1 Tax=Aristolochia fimbriata TaxID=158543 RepID=A0AAV7FFM2_ARIFI|nr:hypothetical protein H6P81_003369 [Aristolochia fimbriata]
MPSLEPKVVIHKLAVLPSILPIKQTQRRFRLELVLEIEKEVDKIIVANFIREVKHPSWIANIVPIKKKSGQIRVCVDFCDLSKVCRKDDFPLPITEFMVDATTCLEALSFMDRSLGYNKIHMDPKDEELMVFQTPKGIFCYKVIPFGLKNANVTYQRAMQHIFDDFIHKRVKCYVDNLVVKSKERIDAIQKMPEPRNISELKIFQGHLAYIRRFISNLAGRCQPFSRLVKKNVPFEWDDACRNAFNSIKAYLTKPPVMVAPIIEKPLLLYIATQENSVGPLPSQNDENNKERSLYYLSRTLVGAELNYTPIKKTCLALIFAVQKLRHYLLTHSTNLISRANPLKYMMSRSIIFGRWAKWARLLSEFEINFVPHRAIIGQALANFLADHPVPAERDLTEEFPDEEIFLVEILP